MNEFPLLGLELMALSAKFTDRRLPALATQYDNATVGSGSIVDEVKHTRTDWSTLEKADFGDCDVVGVDRDGVAVRHVLGDETVVLLPALGWFVLSEVVPVTLYLDERLTARFVPAVIGDLLLLRHRARPPIWKAG